VIRKILIAIAAIAVLYFAIEGGQFGTSDLWRQRQNRQRLQHDLDSLKARVDSLKKYRARLDTDRELQEKLARENFGMVKGDKELLYLIGPPDTTKGPKKP
jgi:cell division protein FtsB